MARRDERTAAARALGDTGRIGAHRDGDECPVCKQPVDTVVKPRKVLGAYVPSYSAGPCHNPRCSAGVDPAEAEVEAGPAAEPENHT
ncbi:hypothetical protein [Streptomyces sp. N35]|uniref:hypothetical protein n=1 Tax=Streptomyces sp. N35 TaxID=2795730 RepID=UPI001F39BBC7|nr:hypothetical protein [Streptomyces sp. N35]